MSIKPVGQTPFYKTKEFKRVTENAVICGGASAAATLALNRGNVKLAARTGLDMALISVGIDLILNLFSKNKAKKANSPNKTV